MTLPTVTGTLVACSTIRPRAVSDVSERANTGNCISIA